MPGELDEISRVLGGMERELQGLAAHVGALVEHHQKTAEEVIEHRGALKVLATQTAENTKAMEDYKATKNKGIGAFWGISIASGSVGAGFATLLARLFSGGTPPLPPGHGG